MVMKISVTYMLEMGQYSPLKEREDGNGYESDYIYADTFEEAAEKAKQIYEAAPQSPFGEILACHQMMLMNFEDEDKEEFSVEGFMNRLAMFDYNTLERQPSGFPMF